MDHEFTGDFSPNAGESIRDYVGEQHLDSGPVNVELLEEVGPAGCPVVRVTGTAPRILDWFLTVYVSGNLREALELMQERVLPVATTV